MKQARRGMPPRRLLRDLEAQYLQASRAQPCGNIFCTGCHTPERVIPTHGESNERRPARRAAQATIRASLGYVSSR